MKKGQTLSISNHANGLRINLLSSTMLARVGVLSLILAGAATVPQAAQAAGLLVNSDTTWDQDHTINDLLVVRGGAGGATLTIKDGAAVKSTSGYIADSRNSVGAVIVSGPGSSWDIVNPDPRGARELFIGGFGNGIYGGKATLTIENGGRVSGKDVYVGALMEGDGKLFVRGAGSTLTADYLGVAVGALTNNNGEVVIEDGGLISSNRADFENGKVLLSGQNSRWINTGEFMIGDSFTIEKGAVVSTGTATLQEQESVDLITMYVDGAGSEFKINDRLTIGEEGSVNLSVANGARLSAGSIVISGSGNFIQEGMGSLTIGGKVEHSRVGGVTALEAQMAGIVDPSAAITFGAGDGHLNFNHTNAGYDFANTIGGKGTINSLAGETILSGDLTKFNGNVNVDGGKLVLKGNLDTTDNDGNVNDALRYSTTKFDVKDGTLIVDGEAGRIQTNAFGGKTYTNSVIVWGENLNRMGNQTSAAFGRLGGSGTVGDTFIDTKAVIAPGNNSTGVLTIAGELEMAGGSIYEADIAGNGSADRIDVKIVDGGVARSGTATIRSGVDVHVTALDAATSYQNGQTYTILTAERGIEGQFAQAVSKSAFLDVALDQKEKQVDLKIAVKSTGPNPNEPRPNEPKPNEPEPNEPNPGTGENPNAGKPAPQVFNGVAVTGNQRDVALALNTLSQNGPALGLYNALLPLDADEARGAFNLLSGEIHSAAQTALVNDSGLLRNAVNDRIRAAFDDVGAPKVPVLAYGPEDKPATAAVGAIAAATIEPQPVVAWGQAFGSWSSIDGNRNSGRLDQSAGGFVTGFDAAVAESVRVGILAGYSRSSFDVDSRLSHGSSDNYHLGIYGGGRWGDLAVRSGVAYTWHSIDTSRTVAFPGFRDRLKADYDAGTFQAFGELGYRIDMAPVAIEPFANLAYVSLHTDSFVEHGAAAALSGRSDTSDTTFTTLGLRASTALTLGGVDTKMRGMVGWQHAYGDATPNSTLGFSTGNAFSVAGTPIAENAAVVEAGLDFALSRNANLGFTYTGQFGSGSRQNGIDAKLNVRF
ncbi:MAG: hypothetical protein BGP09_23745 [Rhizobium sp. 60-20]|jgi:outer membrane autotransporter protein|nr:MAG: hypothetical protein BGP09_23745 [Rhizobium sp. 60-20]RKD67641.1 outer membrane autotransporter protein [Rhizobium sp. WW_1]